MHPRVPPSGLHCALQVQFDDLLDQAPAERERRLAALARSEPELADTLRGMLAVDAELAGQDEEQIPLLAKLLFGRCGTQRRE